MPEESRARITIGSNVIITVIIAAITACTGYIVGTVRENTAQNFRITALENDNHAIHEILRDQLIGVKRFDDFQSIVIENQKDMKRDIQLLREENDYLHGKGRGSRRYDP